MVANDLLYLTFFPKGAILMFNGSEYANLVNASDAAYRDVWKLCDGKNGTPNLINKFIRAGASSGGAGGNDSITLTAANIPLPAHSHGLTGITVETTGAHTHTVSGSAASEGGHVHTVTGTVDSGGAHTHGVSDPGHSHRVGYYGRGSSSGNYTMTDTMQVELRTSGEKTGITINDTNSTHSHGFSNGSTSGGGHTHSLTGTADSGGNHVHKLTGSTDSFGGGAGSDLSISIVPSYYTLVYIMKVK
jgi:hypothetical protein